MNYWIAPSNTLLSLDHPIFTSSIRTTIEKAVCYYFRTNMEVIKQKRRFKWLVEIRQILMYLYKNVCRITLTAIGEILDLDHTTVLYSLVVVDNRLATEPEYKIKIESIIEVMKNRSAK